VEKWERFIEIIIFSVEELCVERSCFHRMGLVKKKLRGTMPKSSLSGTMKTALFDNFEKLLCFFMSYF